MTPMDGDTVSGASPTLGAPIKGDQPTASNDRSGIVAVDQGAAGVVRDGSGKPVAGVMIEAMAEPGTSPVPELAILSDRQGRFLWPLQPGTYRLRANSGGPPVTVTVTPGSVVAVDLIVR